MAKKIDIENAKFTFSNFIFIIYYWYKITILFQKKFLKFFVAHLNSSSCWQLSVDIFCSWHKPLQRS